MDVTPLIRSDQQVIQSYAGGVFKVSGKVYNEAIVVMPDETSLWDVDGAESVESLDIKHFEPLIKKSRAIDVVLLGSGAHMAFLPRNLKNALKETGISVDIMDTGAACRTYNVLMAEGRRVACVLLPAL